MRHHWFVVISRLRWFIGLPISDEFLNPNYVSPRRDIPGMYSCRMDCEVMSAFFLVSRALRTGEPLWLLKKISLNECFTTIYRSKRRENNPAGKYWDQLQSLEYLAFTAVNWSLQDLSVRILLSAPDVAYVRTWST